MENRTSGFAIALTATLTSYLLLMAGFVANAATDPADHAAAKVLGVLAGAGGIALVFLVSRRMLAGADIGSLPGYVPPEERRDI